MSVSVRESIRDMLPQDKHDIDRAVAIMSLGYPAIEPVIPDLLEWMQDLNWPVASALQLPLARVGVPLAVHLRPIFASDDDIWKQVLISRIVAYSPELATELRPELERIASTPTAGERAEEADEAARDVLKGVTS